MKGGSRVRAPNKYFGGKEGGGSRVRTPNKYFGAMKGGSRVKAPNKYFGVRRVGVENPSKTHTYINGKGITILFN
jgi:hypothetical protein